MSRTAQKLLTVLGRRSLDSYILNLLSDQSGLWLPLRETSSSPYPAIADNRNYTAALGAELLTNGDMSSATGWTLNQSPPNSTSAISGGKLVITSDGTNANAVQAVMTVGDTYQYEIDIDAITGGFSFDGIAQVNYTTTGHKTATGIAISTNAIFKRNGACNVTLDNASVKLQGQGDGAYAGPTLGGDTFCGYPCPTLTTDDYIQLSAAWLETIWKPENEAFQFSYMLPVKLSQALWQNATQYVFWSLAYNSSNRAVLYKSAANTLTLLWTVGGESVSRDYTVASSDYGKWLLPAVIIDRAGDTTALAVGSTTSTTTYPAGTWTANNLAAGGCRIGQNFDLLYMTGSVASPFLIMRAITAGEYAEFYNRVRVQEPLTA